jgi:hypothetical protein
MDMQQAVSARTPAHLWIVGILSLLWNCFGAYDYTMTRTRNMEYLSQMGDPNLILNWIDGMPLYAHFGWGLGVWSALLGAVLLLMRSRYALWAFALSLVGMALSFGGQYLEAPAPPELNEGAMKYMPFVIILLGLAQAWYAWRQTKTGVLR